MIKIAIVEDDESSAKKIEEYIKKFGEENGETFSVHWFSDGDEITADYKPQFHIIFLDIQMKRMDGMATAEFIRKLDKDVFLIFISNMAQYAIKGYSVDALDFLLKPVPYFAFSQQLKRSVERLKKRQNFHMLIPTDLGVMRLDVARIIFIESFKHKMLVYTKEDTYSYTGTMKEMEDKLGDKHFFRCNSGYLVNLAFVKGINGNSVLIDKYELAISRPRKKAFMEALAAFVGGMVN